MSNVASIAVSRNVRRPFKLRRVCVTGADVAGLKLLELLLCAEFVGLFISVTMSLPTLVSKRNVPYWKQEYVYGRVDGE